MTDAVMEKTTIRVEQRDKDNMAFIKEKYGLRSDSAAIRYALARVVRQSQEGSTE